MGKKKPEQKLKKRFCDRRDGVRIKDIDGMHYVMPHLMPSRCDSEVYINEKIDVTNMVEYLREKNAGLEDSFSKTTAFHLFVAAISKLIIHRPLLNRFISHKHYYDRRSVIISFVAKRRFEDHSEEALMKLYADGETTLSDVSRRIIGDVHHIREGNSNSLGDTMDFLKKLPRGVMRFLMVIFRFLDRHDMMPDMLTRDDTNYSTVLMSNLGSIKCGAVYHHLNNYGTNSIIATIGEIRKELVYNPATNESAVRDMVEIGVTLDERIADGFYFAKSIKLLVKILQDPKALERPFKEAITDEC